MRTGRRVVRLAWYERRAQRCVQVRREIGVRRLNARIEYGNADPATGVTQRPHLWRMDSAEGR